MKGLMNSRTYRRKVLWCHYYKHWLSRNIKRIMNVGFSSVCYFFHRLFRQLRHSKFLTPFLLRVEGKLHFSTANTASWLFNLATWFSLPHFHVSNHSIAANSKPLKIQYTFDCRKKKSNILGYNGFGQFWNSFIHRKSPVF